MHRSGLITLFLFPFVVYLFMPQVQTAPDGQFHFAIVNCTDDLDCFGWDEMCSLNNTCICRYGSTHVGISEICIHQLTVWEITAVVLFCALVASLVIKCCINCCRPNNQKILVYRRNYQSF